MSLIEEVNELENMEDTRSDRAVRLLNSLLVGNKISKFSDKQIASLMMHYVWSDMVITSPQAVLIFEAIQRLEGREDN